MQIWKFFRQNSFFLLLKHVVDSPFERNHTWAGIPLSVLVSVWIKNWTRGSQSWLHIRFVWWGASRTYNCPHCWWLNQSVGVVLDTCAANTSEFLLCARYCAKNFLWVSSWNPHINHHKFNLHSAEWLSKLPHGYLADLVVESVLNLGVFWLPKPWFPND